jgi:3',5'-cyclic-AMP phosphodiesterase
MAKVKRSCRSVFVLGIIILGAAQAGDKTPSFSFAFLTDLHISSDLVMLRNSELPAPREAVRETPFVGFSRALKEVKELGVDFVVTGGDNLDLMTYRLAPINGRLPVSEDLSVVRDYINKMKTITAQEKLPMYYAIGNHDTYVYPPATPEHPLYGQGLFSAYLGHQGKAYTSFDHRGWHFIVLSTVDGNGHRLGMSEAQYQWLAKDLKETGQDKPIVISGHMPFPISRNGKDIAKKVHDIIENYPVKLMLFGHWHCYHEFTWHGIPCVIGSSVSGAVWSLVRNAHDVSLGEINKGTDQGYLLVTVQGEDIAWKHYPFAYSVEKHLYETTGKRSSPHYGR